MKKKFTLTIIIVLICLLSFTTIIFYGTKDSKLTLDGKNTRIISKFKEEYKLSYSKR